MVTVNSEMQGAVQVVQVDGRLDGFAAPQLETELQNAIKNKHNKIVVDLTKTEFLSSAGMRALLHARQQVQDKRGDLRLVGPSPYIFESLQLVGLDKLFKIFPTTAEALAGF